MGREGRPLLLRDREATRFKVFLENVLGGAPYPGFRLTLSLVKAFDEKRNRNEGVFRLKWDVPEFLLVGEVQIESDQRCLSFPASKAKNRKNRNEPLTLNTAPIVLQVGSFDRKFKEQSNGTLFMAATAPCKYMWPSMYVHGRLMVDLGREKVLLYRMCLKHSKQLKDIPRYMSVESKFHCYSSH